MIVVTLTSWIKRIENVKTVVESIINNTIKPDRVYLNLSKTEFNGIELPKDLVEYFNSDDRLIINWVEGENTKSMKKIFPILKYLNDDDIIIDADDDILFPKDLIESRIKDFEKKNKQYQISSNSHKTVGFDNMCVVSAMSLFTKRMLKNWEIFVNDRVIKTYNDDRTYLYIIYMNGWRNCGPSKYTVQELLDKYDMKLQDSMCSNKIHMVGRAYDNEVKDEVKRITGKSIKDSFGYWKNNYE